MAGQAKPDGILVPKISTVDDLNVIAARLSEVGADPSIQVWAMIETARSVLDADKLAACARDPENAASRLRVRTERHLAGDADQDAAGARGDDPDDHPLHPRGARAWPGDVRRALQRFLQRRRLRAGMRARPRFGLRRQDADLIRARSRPATRSSRRRRKRSRKRAGSWPRSNGRKMPRAAPSSSTGAWWSGCMPTWPSARSRSPTPSPSPRWADQPRLRLRM